MADPMTPPEYVAALRAEGLRVAEYPGWRDHERDDETGKPFGPVHMILNHHTVSRDSLKVIVHGHTGLPGPLANSHLSKTGVVTMTGSGRANHAGLMARNAYTSFRDERAIHPVPLKSSGTVDGNDVAYGLEAENMGDGEDVWPEVQYDAMVRYNAAICRHHKWGADSVAGHLETSVEGKVDPRGPVQGYGTRGRFTFTMAQFRKDVAERLRHPAQWTPPQNTTHPGDDVPDNDTPKRNPTYDAVMRADAVPAPTNAATADENPYWSGENYLKDLGFQTREAHRKLDMLLDHFGIES